MLSGLRESGEKSLSITVRTKKVKPDDVRSNSMAGTFPTDTYVAIFNKSQIQLCLLDWHLL